MRLFIFFKDYTCFRAKNRPCSMKTAPVKFVNKPHRTPKKGLCMKAWAYHTQSLRSFIEFFGADGSVGRRTQFHNSLCFTESYNV